MPRVSIYEGGAVQRQGVTDAKLRAVDNGPSGLAEGLKTAGKTVMAVLDTQDEIESIYDEQNAKKLELERIEFGRAQLRKVKTSFGENAATAASEAKTALADFNGQLLTRARSPRARMMLEDSVARRTIAEVDTVDTHADGEFVKEREATIVAARDNYLEDAFDAPDEESSLAFRQKAEEEIDTLAKWMGKSEDWTLVEKRKLSTSHRIQRARNIVREKGVAAGREYLLANRKEVTGEVLADFMDRTESEFMEEWADARNQGWTPTTTTEEVVEDEDETPSKPATETMIAPFAGAEQKMTSDFGPRVAPRLKNGGRGSDYHPGDDYGGAPGTPIKATLSGRVRIIDSGKDGYGKHVIIDHGQGKTTLYGHLSSFAVKNGQRVKQGEVLGGMGETGAVSGTHLHYEVRIDGKPVNPQLHLRRNHTVNAGGTSRPRVVNVVENRDDSDIENDSTLTPRQKRYLKESRNRIRSQSDQARSRSENEADRAAMMAMFDLDDKFTSVSQLPGGGAGLSPSFALSAQARAKANREGTGQEVDPGKLYELQRIKFEEPERYASPDFWKTLVGDYPPSMIRQVAADSGGNAGQMTAERRARTPLEVTRNTLWGIAKDELLPLGIDLAAKKKGPAAQQQNQILDTLNSAATEWTQRNPGEKPTEQIMRQWIVNATRMAGSTGKRVYEVDDATLANNLSEADRNRIINSLKASGRMHRPSDVGAAYRRMLGVSVVRDRR